ncbi:MAG: hypothetical protein K9J13_11210 [Saprospiraceae bacterium]|nr:hypothetical protein [Saprospiraceae bacterium]
MRKTINCLFLIALLFISFTNCKKNDKDDDKDKDKEKKSEFFIEAEIDGNKVLLEHLKDGYYNGVSSSYTTSGGDHIETNYLIFQPSITTTVFKGTIWIKFTKNMGFGTPSATDIFDMFVVGNYPFGSEDDEIDGVSIMYVDTASEYWATDNDVAIQTGSLFDLTTRTPYVDENTQIKVTGEFNCTLYDDYGNSMTLTNGKFKSYAGFYYY